MKQRHSRIRLVPALGLLAVCLAAHNARAQSDTFAQTNLVSDIPGMAALTDPSLVNPWGIAESATSPFWIADNGTGVTTLYKTNGSKLALTVTLPAPGGSSAPTGAIFNSTTSFNSDLFIFATEDGVIDGWRGSLGTTGETLSNPAGIAGAVYKGLAMGTVAGNNYLYATDFHNDAITVLPGTGAPALSGTFTDPTLPAGYAPFGIRNIGGQLYVTYAKQNAALHDDVAGAGNGFVDIFDLSGNFVKRLVSNGWLNSPWGMTLAPMGFGPFGGDLLVGNFGDGTINAFDPSTGSFLAQLDDPSNTPLVNQGLWGLNFGNGGNGGNTDTLYFTAGIPGDGSVEDHGLFGSLSHVPDSASTLLLVATAMIGMMAWRRYALRTEMAQV